MLVLIMFFDKLFYYDIKNHKTLKYEDQIIPSLEARRFKKEILK